MTKIHMWHRMAYLGLIAVKCGRMVKATQFTDQPEKVTCQACLNAMGKKP
ncbi:hypothetical protein [Pseudomonas typographi]|nr:hypothetical protein [Pseudomonas typographi]MBD1553853.1 hypothetical protein [Pseudomonas typographi]MBD1554255.1 hypothetical protein [Pseudomonas typographi]MBD1554269.1 hypothetical protein [Pseudomonas typographi]MBD1589488.1 hypothetical protein [Pseudomonas typographi]